MTVLQLDYEYYTLNLGDIYLVWIIEGARQDNPRIKEIKTLNFNKHEVIQRYLKLIMKESFSFHIYSMRILGTDIISIQKTSGFFIEKFILFLFIYFRYIISMAIGKVQLPYEFRKKRNW